MATGICNAIYPVDASGAPATPPLSPVDAKSVSLYYEMNTSLTVLPQDQLDLKRDIERFNYILLRVFPPGGDSEQDFRRYYVQMTELARLGIVGNSAMPEIAKLALQSTSSELIESESSRIKNGNLRVLAAVGLKLAAPFALAYLLLRWMPSLDVILNPLFIDSATLANFMLIWIGCFVGVTLSYGMRTQVMTLDDLVLPGTDHLVPVARHLFAGTLTMVIGLMLMMDVFTFEIGDLSSSNLAKAPVVAFLVGVVCGISELLLPNVLKKYSGGLAS